MERSKLVKNLETFTSDTETFKLDVNNLQRMHIGLDALQNGTTAPTLAQLLNAIGEIKIYEGGDILSLIKAVDLWALNKLYWNHRPEYKLSAGDNQSCQLNGLWFPVGITTPRELKAWMQFVGHSTIDTTKLTVGVHFGDKPLGKGIAVGYLTDTATSDFKEKDMSKTGRSLAALMLHATTVKGGATTTQTIEEIKTKVNTVEIGHYRWEELDERFGGNGDSNELPLLQNYRLLTFEEPLPAENLKIAVKGTAADAYRLVGIYV